jgi:gamma-glutamyltranspeptidase/glutathione hydrolase
MSPGPFSLGCVASPHHLASAVGLEVLEQGGNALDAAVATNLALGVVTPYLCGYGGDLFALIWAEGRIHGYAGAGRAPASATPEEVRALGGSQRMPVVGPLTVTVPGAVDGWFALLERFGSRDFGVLAAPAVSLAKDGFELSERAAESLARASGVCGRSPEWQATYGAARPGERLRQPALARTIEVLAAEGRDAYYRGAIGAAIAGHVRGSGGLLEEQDLAAHEGEWVEPLRAPFGDVEVVELPPPSQGVAALEALRIAERVGVPQEGALRQHLLIESMKLALADRDRHLSDPSDMELVAEDLLSEAWIRDRADGVDPSSARTPAPGRSAIAGTAYLCAADGDGMMVSLIQSNYMGFGSGVTVPEWGINLQNRGAYFSLRDDHVNVIAPGKRTLHTLMPAMALRDGSPWMVFGAMGGDGQAQTHLQLVTRMALDGTPPQEAIDAPRWIVDPGTWSVTVESRFAPPLVEDLRSRGHRVAVTGPFDSLLGHAHTIQRTPEGYVAGTDPRAEGAALGR